MSESRETAIELRLALLCATRETALERRLSAMSKSFTPPLSNDLTLASDLVRCWREYLASTAEIDAMAESSAKGSLKGIRDAQQRQTAAFNEARALLARGDEHG